MKMISIQAARDNCDKLLFIVPNWSAHYTVLIEEQESATMLRCTYSSSEDKSVYRYDNCFIQSYLTINRNKDKHRYSVQVGHSHLNALCRLCTTTIKVGRSRA